MTLVPLGDWWRRLHARRADPASLLARAWPRRWVVGYLEVCVFVGTLRLVTDVVATSTGEAASLPQALFVGTYYVVPLVVVLLFAFAVSASFFLLVADVLQPFQPPRTLLRALAEAACVWLSLWLLFGMSRWSSELRMRRLEAVTRRLTPAAIAHLADPQRHALPSLGVRGCTEPKRVDYDDGHSELWAECSRGIGRWDQLFLRSDGRYENPERIQRLGAWAYLWD